MSKARVVLFPGKTSRIIKRLSSTSHIEPLRLLGTLTLEKRKSRLSHVRVVLWTWLRTEKTWGLL